MGGQNGKPADLTKQFTIEQDSGSAPADTSRMAPHQISVQKPIEKVFSDSVDPPSSQSPDEGNIKSCSEETNHTNGEDLDSLIEFLESDDIDPELKGSGQSCFAKNTDLDDLVEMLERDVVNPNSVAKRSPTPIYRACTDAPSTPYHEFNLTPMHSARCKQANGDLAAGDSDLEEWAGLLEDSKTVMQRKGSGVS